MRARATTTFAGVRDGGVYPDTIAEGEIVQGALATTAVAGGLAVEIGDDDQEPAAEPTAAPAPKAKRKGKG